jgi:thiaminase (transcriptional activator TenA)
MRTRLPDRALRPGRVSSQERLPVRFSDELRRAADEVWEAMHEHAFVRGIGDGTLDPERFRFYVRQDYLFLIDYGRLLALGCARAPRLEVMASFAELTQSILVTEMDLHRAYATDWHISDEQLQREPAHPTTRAYTDFLLRTATLGDFGELVAALLPCMWGYSELGQRLARSGPPIEARYARWIETYSSEDFAELARWCREICDEAATDAPERTRARMQDAFLASSRHELAFWESAWRSTS